MHTHESVFWLQAFDIVKAELPPLWAFIINVLCFDLAAGPFI